MVEYQLFMILFWLSITTQLTVMNTWLWLDTSGWSLRVFVAVVFPLTLILTVILMVGLAIISGLLERKFSINRRHLLNAWSVPFAWTTIAAYGYAPLVVMGLRVIYGWGYPNAYAAGLLVGLIAGILGTLLCAVVFAVPPAILLGIGTAVHKIRQKKA